MEMKESILAQVQVSHIVKGGNMQRNAKNRHPGYCEQQKTHHGNTNPKSFWLSLLIKLLCTTFDTHSTTFLPFFFFF